MISGKEDAMWRNGDIKTNREGFMIIEEGALIELEENDFPYQLKQFNKPDEIKKKKDTYSDDKDMPF